ncbi:MAG: response regulator [Lentisphaeria bacterium]|nr:response regulator [Lentisphaeria bacterium]
MMTTHAKQRIWIVDDDPSVRQALARLLQSHGYTVETFSSGVDISPCPESNPVDCLLLDVYLPTENGVEIFDRMREAGFSSPVIFITAKSTGFLTAKARERADLLVKPFDSAAVLAAVAQAASAP